ncbi:uncharacterized protein TNCV_455531 [Trichonephila clavipes]|nr:uncharacterized protein TNCV_455531 [Trichonephila clavipes]
MQCSTVVSREAKSDAKTHGQGYLGNFSVSAFAENLNMKDACYMLAEAQDSLEKQGLKNAWNKLWSDLEGEKDLNDDHREEMTDFVQSIPGFRECDEDVETCGWHAMQKTVDFKCYMIMIRARRTRPFRR